MSPSIQTASIDAGRLWLMLNDLRLPELAGLSRAGRQGKLACGAPVGRIGRARDRREGPPPPDRYLAEAQLLLGKTLDSFDFDVVPMVSKAHILAICAGDSWIDKGANLLLIGGPGGGKTHLASAISLALVGRWENGLRALFARTSDLVQRALLQFPDADTRGLAVGYVSLLGCLQLHPLADELDCFCYGRRTDIEGALDNAGFAA